MSSWSCPCFDERTDACRRIGVPCVPGRKGCILPRNLKFAVPPELRVRGVPTTPPLISFTTAATPCKPSDDQAGSAADAALPPTLSPPSQASAGSPAGAPPPSLPRKDLRWQALGPETLRDWEDGAIDFERNRLLRRYYERVASGQGLDDEEHVHGAAVRALQMAHRQGVTIAPRAGRRTGHGFPSIRLGLEVWAGVPKSVTINAQRVDVALEYTLEERRRIEAASRGGAGPVGAYEYVGE